MRILYLVGGRNALWGEATVRDAAFVRGLRNAGHEVDAVSLEGPALVDDDLNDAKLFLPLGQGKLHRMFPRLTRVPQALASLIKKPHPVANMTSFAVDGHVDRIGPEAVSRLSGRHKQLRREFAKLLEYIRFKNAQPEIVVLDNIMLSGLAEPLKGALDCKVVSMSQGADRFIESLSEPYRSDARKLARKNARHLAAVFTASRYFAIRATEFLALPPTRVQVVHPGINGDRFINELPRNRHPFTIGFLAPISNKTGLDILIDAINTLMKNTKIKPLLWIAGPVEDERYWHRMQHRLETPAFKDKFKIFGELDARGRKDFYHKLSAFAVSSREPESKGVVILEAMAAGIPVIAPSTGIIPEIFQFANGGLLVSSEAPVWMYAQAFEVLATIPETADQMGKTAAEGVRTYFSIERSAYRLAALLSEFSNKTASEESPKNAG